MILRYLAAALVAATLLAQPPAGRPPQPPPVVSPEVKPDRSITFRILAPSAQSVQLNGGDIQGLSADARKMTKNEKGIWEVTVPPVVPGAYRYTFNVDGVTVVDPRNPTVSESNNNTWSLVPVPGSELMDARNVPHGAVSSITYYSSALGRNRRMQIYTPPGYTNTNAKYPVFYLLHGASDSDYSWSTVGRAGFILDNLIAAKKAKPMIVVMPAGHTNAGGFRVPGARDEFARDFVEDIMPYVEKTYRVYTDRAHRAIAGLSMGGNQTLAVLTSNPDKFAYAGVFSSGLIGAFGRTRPGAPEPPPGPSWEEQNKAALENANLKKGLKLFWFGTGKDDFLVETSRKTVELFKKYGFQPVYNETAGAHTWLVWRGYLGEFAPRLFQ
ncbi:MAG: esterase [Acidobacteria bacterium]|nr:esterase [Acidobacteriota bacterium]